MTAVAVPASPSPAFYPETDGKPMAENTLQFQWITTIVGGLEALFADRPDVFVAGDLLWYPVQGQPGVVVAPDALVAFGRPAGHRGSYRQWEEGGITPQVVFEVLSPSNRRVGEVLAKFEFYRRYGVEEYYLYDPEPDRMELSGFLRRGGDLVEIPAIHGHVSPRLGIRFEMGPDGLRLLGPDGQPFATYKELARQRKQEHEREQQHERAEQERERADRLQAELDSLRRAAGSEGPAAT